MIWGFRIERKQDWAHQIERMQEGLASDVKRGGYIYIYIYEVDNITSEMVQSLKILL